MSADKLIDIECEIIAETDLAVKIDDTRTIGAR